MHDVSDFHNMGGAINQTQILDGIQGRLKSSAVTEKCTSVTGIKNAKHFLQLVADATAESKASDTMHQYNEIVPNLLANKIRRFQITHQTLMNSQIPRTRIVYADLRPDSAEYLNEELSAEVRWKLPIVKRVSQPSILRVKTPQVPTRTTFTPRKPPRESHREFQLVQVDAILAKIPISREILERALVDPLDCQKPLLPAIQTPVSDDESEPEIKHVDKPKRIKVRMQKKLLSRPPVIKEPGDTLKPTTAKSESIRRPAFFPSSPTSRSNSRAANALDNFDLADRKFQWFGPGGSSEHRPRSQLSFFDKHSPFEL